MTNNILNTLLKDYFDIGQPYNMSFGFRIIQNDDGKIITEILEQPNYATAQDTSDLATERILGGNGYYCISNDMTPANLEEAKSQLADWCSRTAYAIYHNLPRTLIKNGDSNVSIDNMTDLDAIDDFESEVSSSIHIDPELLFEKLNEQIHGQEVALQSISNQISQHIGKKNPQRPAVIFAVGPSGVGKTKTAICLADVLNSFITSEQRYHCLRLDMSEYQEAHRISQLAGSPQGYVGHGESSELITALRNNPNTIVVFDEIEKANPNILKFLMNTMDAGRLSSASAENGEYQIDCKKAIFIFTSNLDASGVLEEIKSNNIESDAIAQDQIARKRFVLAGVPKELIGRMGAVVVYQPIAKKYRANVVLSTIKEIGNEFGVSVNYVEPTIVTSILKHKSSGDFGARMERIRIENMLGSALLTASHKNFQEVKILDNPIRCETA